MVRTEAEAEAAVRAALLPYGGLPRDAVLTRRSGEMAMMTGPVAELPSNPARRMSYFFRSTPRGVIAGPDSIWAIVDDAERRTCLDASCRSYKLEYHLEVTSLQRNWRSAWPRSLAAWWNRTRTTPAPMPIDAHAQCAGGGFDIDAFRRVVGSVNMVATYQSLRSPKNRMPVVRGRYASAHFAPFRLMIDPKYREDFYVRAAVVGDESEESPERSVFLLAWHYDSPYKKSRGRNLNRDAPYWWEHFESSDSERICIGAVPARHSTLARKSESRLIPPIIDARFRFWNEIEQQNAFRVKFDLHPHVTMTRERSGKSVTIDWGTDRGVWHGAYHYAPSGRLEAVRIDRP